jgi:S1-C subfamily serine protease
MQDKHMKGKIILLAFVLVFIAGISGLGGAVLGIAYYSQFAQVSISQPTALPVIATTAAPATLPQLIQVSNTEIETDITQAVEKVGPAVVTVVGTITGQVDFFGRTAEAQSSGSGVVISTDGYVLTNNHVIENAKKIVVILNDGTELDAQLINTDLYADLAVLKTSASLPVAATLGNSDNLKPGETVIAIGSPLGDFRNTVTVGVVSATNRSLDTGNGYQMEGLIQTDAAINQGNSGGPLINLAGEVIGINTVVVRGSSSTSTVAEGLGFSVPSNTAVVISSQIIEKGYFARPYLGVQTQTISPAINQRYNLGTDYGEYITEVVSGSPAEQAGLQVGDILTQIGDVQIGQDTPFVNALYTYSAGDSVPVTFLRAGQWMQTTVQLGETTLN